MLELNTKSGRVRRIHQGDGLYYGLAASDSSIYVAARKRMVSSDTPAEEERGEILVFDLDLNLKERLQAPFPLRDLHQIAWHDEMLWVTCSYDNMVAIWDGKEWQQWYPLGETPDSSRDVHHYNSLFFEGDLVWVLAHNRGPSELLAYSLQNRNLVKRIELGNQAHNIWHEQGQLFTCSSGSGKILGDFGFELETGGFPRGCAFDGELRYVGISELAEKKDRDLTTGRVLVYDKAWKFVNEINLPGEGLVLDLLLLPDIKSQNITAPPQREKVAGGVVFRLFGIVKSAFKMNINLLLARTKLYVNRRPRLRLIALAVLAPFPSWERRLRQVTAIPLSRYRVQPAVAAELTNLTPRARRIYAALKAAIGTRSKRNGE